MPACTACGNFLSTDYLRVCGDDQGALDACPHCRASVAQRSPQTTPAGSGTANAGNAGNDGATSSPTTTLESADEASTSDGEPADSAFTVRTAGRSLEWPRGSSDAGRSRADRSSDRSRSTGPPDEHRSSRSRFRTPLSTVLDVFR